MKSVLAAACLAAITLAAPAGATPEGAGPAPTNPVFTELQALGFDLGKFRPDYVGRFPYR